GQQQGGQQQGGQQQGGQQQGGQQQGGQQQGGQQQGAGGGAQGFLSLNTTPWSQVYIDGGFVKNTPVMRHQLAAGRHRITCINQQFNLRVTFQVTVRAGQTQTIVKNLMGGAEGGGAQ
ncbi:MAG: PEGA domain-containing protein, partial [Deltaproteobacteria bacterium]|nr:PEGA domain-containing protein [Deltaproteobacteria bacterium]